MRTLRPALVLAVLVLVGCGGVRGEDVGRSTDTGADEEILRDPKVLWAPGGDVPDLPAAISGDPVLADISAWSFLLEETPDVPTYMHLPAFAVANGALFSMIGYGLPLNTLHSMIGPAYQKDGDYFSDLWVEIASGPDGAPLSWTRQWIGRVMVAPIIITYAERPGLSLTTVDLAPALIDESGEGSVRLVPGMLRLVVVQATGGQPLDSLWIRAVTAMPQAALPGKVGAVLEEKGENARALAWFGPGAAEAEEAMLGERSLAVPLGSVSPGEDLVLYLGAGTGKGANHAASALADLELISGDMAGALASTRRYWSHQWRRGEALRVETPDPMVNQFLDNALLIVLSQIAETGAICPMSHYTRTWLRDCGGPVRYLSRLGLLAEARGIIDYLWVAAVNEGGLRNSYPADLDAGLLETTEPPDWESLPVLSGRARAESPSYLPLMYGWYVDASGDLDVLEGRLPMLAHALFKQDFRGDLLPFSGDETFRTAMAIAHDLPVDESFEEDVLSANSSFLWVAAAEVLGVLAEAAGDPVLGVDLAEQAAVVFEAAEATYLQADGVYAPYVSELDLAPAPAAFEDVNTKPLWCGYRPRFDPGAQENLAGTMEALGGDDGVLVSPLPQGYVGWMGLPIEAGIYTGMSPGYYLQNLASERHPAAEAAFNALRFHADAGGSTPEYAALDGPHPLQIMYDPTGSEPADYAARYRPWEGAIVADAALEYLFGLRQDALRSRLELSPSLPNGWSWSEANGIRVGESRVDLRVERQAGTWTLRLTHVAGPALEVAVDLPWPVDGATATATRDGEPMGSAGSLNRFGVGIVQLDAISLAPESEAVLVVR